MALSATARTRGRGASPATSSAPALRWAGWIIASGFWCFLILALISFSPDDPPSHTVSAWNGPVDNLGGQLGAWLAYGSFHLVGWGIWVLAAGTGTWFILKLIGKQPGHAPLRAVGLVLAAIGLSSLHAAVLPTMGGLAGAPGGLIGHTLVGAVTPQIGGLGTALLTLVLLLGGLVIAADEVMLALPGWALERVRSIPLRAPRPRFGWVRALGIRPDGGTATMDEEEDTETWEDDVEDAWEEDEEPEAEDEYEDEYEYDYED